MQVNVGRLTVVGTILWERDLERKQAKESESSTTAISTLIHCPWLRM